MKAQDKIPKDALDVPELIRATNDAIALVGAANFELNMRRKDNIKPELNEDYLTITPVARKGYGSIAHEANGLLTGGP